MHFTATAWQRVTTFDKDCAAAHELGRLGVVVGGPVLVPVNDPPYVSSRRGSVECYEAGCPRLPAPYPVDPHITETTADAATGTASRDLWVVGSVSYGGTSQLMVDHHVHAGWTMTLSPLYARQHVLNDVVELSTGDVWAVGSRTGDTGYVRTLIVHVLSDGTYLDLGGPNQTSSRSDLRAITAVPGPGSEMWAVGFSGNLGGGDKLPLILHHP
jgi:hypothetical protein